MSVAAVAARRGGARDKIQRRPGEGVAAGCGRLHRWPAPKSIRTTRPPSSRMTLCALTSPWMSPLAWTAASAPHSARPMTIASSALWAPRASTSAASVRPCTNSIHRPTRPSCSSAPWTTTMFGCLTLARRRPSSRTREDEIVAAEARRQQLHGDVTAERIDGPIDLRERAAADRLLETQRAPGPAAQVHAGAGRRRRRPDRFEGVVLCDRGHARQHAEAWITRAPRRRRRPVPRLPSRSARPRRRGRRARGGRPAGHRASRVISLTSRATARWVATREATALGRPSRSASSL